MLHNTDYCSTEILKIVLLSGLRSELASRDVWSIMFSCLPNGVEFIFGIKIKNSRIDVPQNYLKLD